MTDHLPATNSEAQYEKLISELIDRHFGVCNDFLSQELSTGLRQNLIKAYEKGRMHPAGIGKKFDHQKNLAIRGDVILWIDKDSRDVYERSFLDKMEGFIKYLNRTCYTGITDCEFHYAFYDKFSFYKRHRDQFKTDKGRKFSLVTYLNDDWQLSDGGSLSLYLDDLEAKLYPKDGRTVLFKSDQVEHEVHPSSSRPRLSITGWLKVSEQAADY